MVRRRRYPGNAQTRTMALLNSHKGMPLQPDLLADQFALFLEVLERGSFSAAARSRGLTPSAVARRMDALEKALGSCLFNRSTHQVRPTAAALAFAERARRIVLELQLARAETAALETAPAGRIRIDAPAPFGRRHLAPALADFLPQYPQVDIQLRLIDSFVDPAGEHLGQVDLVLRIGPLADTRRVATPLSPMVRLACASPHYLARRGAPQTPDELADHEGLDWDGLAPAHAWRFEREGRTQTVRPGRLRLLTNNAEALLTGAIAGLGVAHLPTWLASDALLRGELVPLFCEAGLPEPEPSGIYALRMSRDADARTRLLLEFLKARFGPEAPWDQALRSGLAQR